MKKALKILLLFLPVLLFGIVCVYNYKREDKDYSKTNIIDSEKDIIEEEKVEFNNKGNLKKIVVKFDSNVVEFKEKINIQILDKDDKAIIDEDVDTKKLDYEKKYTINISEKKQKSEYVLKIKNDNEEVLKIKEINIYNYHHSNKKIFTIVLFVISLLTCGLLLIVNKFNIPIEKCYLISAIIVYFLFLLLLPLFTAHDELYHWFRAYEVSEGRLLSEVNDNKAYSHLPISVIQINNEKLRNIDYRSIKESLEVKSDDAQTLYDMRTVAVYSPVQYLPQATGIFIARKITNRTLIMAYFGRIFNALFAIVMIYFAIKIIPFGKRIIYTIAFLPIAIEGFTSLSADAITVSTAILFISYILMLVYDNKIKTIRKRDIFILFALCSILAFCKIVYIPLIFLCFLIPKNKYKNKKYYYITNISIAVICLIFNLGWLKIASSYLALYSTTNVQTTSILSHPFNYIQIVLYTFFNNFQRYIFTMLGNELGWEEFIRPLSIIPVSYLLLLIVNSLFDKQSNNKLHLKENIAFGLISLLIGGLIFTSLYVQFTKPGNIEIAGIQGRYFIPFLPLLLLLIGNFKTMYSNKIDLNKVTVSTCLILSYSVLLTLFIQFL